MGTWTAPNAEVVAKYGTLPTSGWPMEEPRRMMCQKRYKGSLDDINGYVVYDMYFNA